ncbi:MAG: DEAD/DEAH box helicase [Terriglobia bacterium]
MIVLHAGVCDSRFLLWGETPVGLATRPRRRRGHQPKSPRPERLLYDAGADGLMATLVEAGTSVTTSKGHAETAVAWLPTVGDTPIASSPLVAEPPTSRAKTVLAPWIVTVLPLPTEQTVEVLCACVGKQLLAPGVIVGKDLAFWTVAMRFAGALVARHQFLPGITEERTAYRARWKPVFAGSDADLLATLARAMPHVSRALTHEAASPPETPAGVVLADFVGALVDHFVRSPWAAPPAPRRPKGRRAPQAPTFDSVHDQWVHALWSPDGVMEGDAATLAELTTQVRAWQHPITVSTAAPFRLCFRLEEPGDNGHGTARRRSDAWYVRYLLQAADDPSLLIPTPDAWKAKGRRASLLQRGDFSAREYLLMSLGQAAGICPRIEGSLEASAPGGYALNATGAYAFLTEEALMLEQAGFGVMLPAWWTRKGTKLRLSVRANVKSPKMQGGSGLSLDRMVRFNWEVALGDERLTREELEELARLKAPLVKVRGQWVQMSAEEIQTALDFWKQQASQQATAREVVQMALGTGKTPGTLAFEGVTATGWVADLLAQLEGRTAFEEFPAPDGFQGALRPYQVRGYSWLGFLRRWGLGACLADDMGLGKTIETLALIQRDWQANGKRPVLLVCPTSVVGNWQKEAARFTPDLPVMVHHGTTRSRGARFKEQAMVISSYALLQRDFDHLKQVPWAGVILDEAQNIKNPETKQAQSARALPAEYRVALTGTPVENNVGDLWSIIEFLNPGFLGTQTEFKRQFFVPIQANRDPDAVARLQRLTRPFILRRLKTDKAIIADLPDKMEMKVFCTLTREQASLYTAVVREAEHDLEEAEGIQRRGMILATLSKLKQVCNHPTQFLGDNSAIPGRSGKLARLTEMLEEILEVGERALVFTQFAEMGDLLQRYLQETFGREVLFLHGGVRKAQRDRMVARFQAEGDGPPVFLLSLKAGGTGLNLTRANHVFHFDRWWNPAVENQATDRAFRIGQTRNVRVHKFLCVGTLEERIDEMIERKKEIAEGVVGTGEGWLTELSTAELKQLFALSQEAIGE